MITIWRQLPKEKMLDLEDLCYGFYFGPGLNFELDNFFKIMKNSWMQERDKRKNFPSSVVKCHLLHVGIAASARYEHMWKAHYSSECVIWMTACNAPALVSHPAESTQKVLWGHSIQNTSPRMITTLSGFWESQESWAELRSSVGSGPSGPTGWASAPSVCPPPQRCWQCVTHCLLMVQEEPKLVSPNSDISEDNERVDQRITVQLGYYNVILFS